jgi:hypothetical protein
MNPEALNNFWVAFTIGCFIAPFWGLALTRWIFELLRLLHLFQGEEFGPYKNTLRPK